MGRGEQVDTAPHQRGTCCIQSLHIECIMRTNINIDDALMEEAQKLTGLPTKKAVVTEALQLLVRLRRQAKIKDLVGKVRWEGDLDQMRGRRKPEGE